MRMGSVTVNITYETLFDLSRNEGKDNLQQLPEKFYVELVQYLQEKNKLMESPEREKTAKQLQNVHRLVRDIYERRETKLLQLAAAAARGSEPSMDTMLPPERELFEQVRDLLKHTRKEVIARLLKGEEPGKLTAPPAEQAPPGPEADALMVQFQAHVPKFLGTALEIYGPFEPGEMANLPREIGELLVRKGRAQALQ